MCSSGLNNSPRAGKRVFAPRHIPIVVFEVVDSQGV